MRQPSTLENYRQHALTAANRLSWLGPLLGRLTVAAVFIGTGWGKLHSLDRVTSFFTELGIPAAAFQARLVAVTEFAGGLAVLVGLATRLVSIPLAFTMVVAILTAKRTEIDGPLTLLAFEEFTYLCIFVWLVVAGPGAVSLDALIGRWLSQRESAGGSARPSGPARTPPL